MEKIIEILQSNRDNIIIGIISSTIATIVVLLTRTLYYRFIDTLPANRLFNQIKNSKEKCIVYQVRLRDKELKGEFVTPLPDYSQYPNKNPVYEGRKLTPYVLSAEDSAAVASILNTLGKVGRTKNIQIAYIDKDYDKWENPMFLVGGSWKLDSVYNNYNPYYTYNNGQFILKATNEIFYQKQSNDDLGLLQKVYNTTNNKPIWIAVGMRGGGTAAAAYSLVRWWKMFGRLYGKKPFGIIVKFSDKDGWQSSSIISYYPVPRLINRLIYFRVYWRLKKMITKYYCPQHKASFMASSSSPIRGNAS